MLKVTLVKSLIGNTPANRATVHALGLRKIGQSNTFEPTGSILGMIHKVKHLLQVEEVDGGEKVRRRQNKTSKPATEGKSKAASKKAATATAEKKAPAKKTAEKKAPAKKATTTTKSKAASDDKPKAKRTTKKKTEDSK